MGKRIIVKDGTQFIAHLHNNITIRKSVAGYQPGLLWNVTIMFLA